MSHLFWASCTSMVRGVQQNDVEAARWLRVGAEHGVARAQLLLSEMCEVGHGVPQDYVLATCGVVCLRLKVSGARNSSETTWKNV
jgi:uncharacterized protein